MEQIAAESGTVNVLETVKTQQERFIQGLEDISTALITLNETRNEYKQLLSDKNILKTIEQHKDC